MKYIVGDFAVYEKTDDPDYIVIRDRATKQYIAVPIDLAIKLGMALISQASDVALVADQEEDVITIPARRAVKEIKLKEGQTFFNDTNGAWDDGETNGSKGKEDNDHDGKRRGGDERKLLLDL